MLLVVLNGAETDAEVTKVACNLAREYKESVELLYVVEVSREFPLDKEMTEEIRNGDELLGKMEKIAKSHKVKVSGQLLQSRSKESAIVNHAHEEGANSIVISATYKSQYREQAIGGSLNYILETAACNVIICKFEKN
tara:strand:- start:153 stop:566 length:414 start_codon:yes stop_codon:yes gene_type:complete